MQTYIRLGLLVIIVVLALGRSAETSASPGATERVSVNTAGAEGNSDSNNAAISSDGRYVAFDSPASNLVSGDANGCQDVFVRDRVTRVTERASVTTGGAEATRASLHPAVSADARFVSFDSLAPDLVGGDTNDTVDVFVRDRQTSSTERVSLSSGGGEGDDTSWYPAISADGRFVAFESFATNLVTGDTNSAEDVFVRDRQTGVTVRISLSSSGVQGNNGSWDAAIGGDGRFVAFGSDATNLVGGDTNGMGDIFVRDRDTDGNGIFDETGAVSTTRVSVSSGGTQGNGDSYYAAISADGRYVAFASASSNLVTGDTNGYSDVFVHDRQTGTTTRVSVDSLGTQGNNTSFTPAVNSDGRYVAFESYATNLVTGDTNAVEDVFVRDRQAGTTALVSLGSAGSQGDDASYAPAISGNGRWTAFESLAGNLVPLDTNDASDVFLHDKDFSAVGGIAELPDVSDSSAPDSTTLAGLAAAGLVVTLTAGTHYGRWRRRR